MNTDHKDLKYKELTEKIIKIFYKVYNKLGYGFLEKVYENAMMIEFRKEGIPIASQAPIKVFYENVPPLSCTSRGPLNFYHQQCLRT